MAYDGMATAMTSLVVNSTTSMCDVFVCGELPTTAETMPDPEMALMVCLPHAGAARG